MEEKYYTPTIEEIHVGFEYEWQFGDKWDTKRICCLTDIDNGLNGYIESKRIRVKYLDNKDIQECGWLFAGKGVRLFYKGPESWFNKTIPSGDSGRYWEFKLEWDPNFKSVIITTKTNSNEWEKFFEGKINNKWELRTIKHSLA